MKKILSTVAASIAGGIIALGSYVMFIEETPQQSPTPIAHKSVLPVNYTNTIKTIKTPDFTEAAEKTVNTVVHVKNESISTGTPTLQDLFIGRVPQQTRLGTGSGVIISPDGHIITNNHVIDGAQKLSVTLNNNKTFNATVIGTDAKTDIALIKIDADYDLPYTTFADSDNAKIGEWVLAVGNPYSLTSTVTAGIISAKSRDLSGQSIQSFIQTDAAVNPGNSGGALVNTNGDLVGINTAISSKTGSYVGYSFAVPSNIAKKVIQDIMEFGDVQNGVLGISGTALNSENAIQLDTKDTEGFYVGKVDKDSGAEKAGLLTGDIIKQIDNVNIKKFTDLVGHLAAKRPNDVVNITILRDGDTITKPVTLLKKNTFTIPAIGTVKNLTKKELRKAKVKNGVIITNLYRQNSSNLQRGGIQEGSIIISINNNPVKNIDDVKTFIANKSPYEQLIMEIINTNGEKERYYFK